MMIHPYIILYLVLWGLCCGVVGTVFVAILGDEDTPFNKWLEWTGRIRRTRTGLKAWLASSAGGCAKCFAGQLALWSTIIMHRAAIANNTNTFAVSAADPFGPLSLGSGPAWAFALIGNVGGLIIAKGAKATDANGLRLLAYAFDKWIAP